MEWVTIGINFLLMIFTGILMYLTYKMLQEAKRTIDETCRPEVVVFLRSEIPPKSNSFYYFKILFCVQNSGSGAARKVRFEGDLSFNPKDSSLDKIEFVKNGIDVLVPGEMLSKTIFLGNRPFHHKEFCEISESKAEINVAYKNINKKGYSQDFTLDLSEINIYKS